MNSLLQKCFVIFVVFSLTINQVMPVLADSQEKKLEESSSTLVNTESNATQSVLDKIPIVKLTNDATTVGVSESEVTAETNIQIPIEIKLVATPESLESAGEIVLDWAINGISEKDINGFTLEIILPDNFEPVTDPKVTFEKNTISTPVTALTGNIKIKTNSAPTSDVFFSANLLDKNQNLIAFTELILPFKTEYEIKGQVDEIYYEEKGLTVTFDENTVQEYSKGIEIEIGTPSDIEAIQASFSGQPFEIKAKEKIKQTDIETFDEPVEFKINLDEFGYSDVKNGELFIYWYNPETGGWQGMISWIDEKTNTLYSQTDHFSIFDVGANNWEASKKPSINAFQVSTFTGAATYSLPIELPAGPGGFQPSLSLNYNSQVIDQSTHWSQVGWVGAGWSLDTGSIELNSKNDYDPNNDSYSLSFNGMSTEIINTSQGWKLAHENFMKVSFDGNKWTLWDKQGLIYEFEYKTIMKGVWGCDDVRQFINKWSLTKIKNIFGQEINYTYSKETKIIPHMTWSAPHNQCRMYGQATSDTASYPATITYAGGRVQVRFVLEARSDYNLDHLNDQIHHSFERSRLDQVIIEQDLDANGSFESIIRKYDLTYATTTNKVWPNVTYSGGGSPSTLASVTEYGAGGTTALPTTTFTYGDAMHLTQANNGYGGVVTFAYESWYYPVARGSHQNIWNDIGGAGYLYGPGSLGHLPWSTSGPMKPGGAYYLGAIIRSGDSGYLRLFDGTSSQTTPLVSGTAGAIFMLPATATIWSISPSNTKAQFYNPNTWNAKLYYSDFSTLTTIYRVTTKTLQDGNGHSYAYTYTYTGAAVNDDVRSYGSLNNQSYSEKYSEFRGHATVTETGPDGVQTVTSFYQDDVYRGRAYNTQIKVGGVKRSETISVYSNTVLSGFTYYTKSIPRNWTKLDSTENRIYDNNGTSYNATKTVYTYETTYGNLLTQTEQSWNGSTWADYRKTENFYWYNNSATKYLVSLPAKTKIYDGAGATLGINIYLYDGNTGDHQTMPINGKLTSVRTLIDITNSTFNQISFGYDAWGNQTTQTTWSGYGTWNTNPSSGTRTSTTVYDSVFHTYPISQTTPSTPNASQGLTTQWNYDYDGNGVNDFILGIPTKQTDSNGNQIEVQYDAFGRIIKLIRPQDSISSPTMSFSYSNSYPFTTVLVQKINASDSYTVTKKYDGLGRQFYVNTGGTIIDTVYQSSTVTLQSTPHFSGETVYYTTTTINPSANTSSMTAPDGNSTTTFVNGLSATVTDPKGNVTSSTKDVWGRVIQVTPPTGPGVGYTYDEMNRLLTATRAGNVTQINYDIAGRKLFMDDPDMGSWFYEYDALGNLTKQTDAKNQVICLFYDNLNRLNGKTYPANGSCGTPVSFAAEFNYDENTNGLGRRTSMEDASGNTSWTYDARGRVVNEVKVISGQSFSTAWTYNSADLPITMTYPDNEILTYAYNNRMLLNSVTSSLSGTTYVNSTNYDSAGRLTDRVLGNNLTQTYNYYNWNEQFNNIGQGGRLKSMSVGTIQNLNYSYDKNGNVLNINDAITSEVQAFGYDTLNRLTSSTVTNGLAPYNESYSYDSSTGNLASKNGINYQYTDPNHVHAATSLSNGNSYTYDANGNMTDRNVNSQAFDLIYDEENRLTTVTMGQASAPSTFANSGADSQSLVSYRSDSINAMPILQTGDTPTPTQPPTTYTLTLQPNDIDGIDAGIVSSSSPTTNYGTDGDMGVGENNNTTNKIARSLIKFDLSALPANAVITSTTLSLWTSQDVSSTDRTIQVYRLKVPFVENQATWNISATGVNWQTAGAAGANDREAISIGSIQILNNEALNTEKQISLDTLKMQELINGSFTNNGFIIIADTELNDRFNYKTSDSTSASQRPKLVIQYTLSNSTPTPTPTGPTNTPIASPSGTVTLTPSNTPTPTGPTNTPIASPSGTVTLTPSNTPTPTSTNTPIFTATPTITPTPSTPVFSNATFSYDGDGKRVKSVLTTNVGVTTTYFVNSYYEVTGPNITKYYYAGNQRIAMRKYRNVVSVPENPAPNNLYYLLGDHLGSTSLVTDASGTVINQTKYKAWGETRYSSGTEQTKYTYTGQYSYTSDFGLMFYNARWYDSSLSRFAQADTIVPGGVQGLDRYAYVNNSPLNYIDPSGHVPVDCLEDGYCGYYKNLTPGMLINRATNNGNGVYSGGSLYDYENDILAQDIELYMSSHPNYDPTEDFYLKSDESNATAFNYLREKYWIQRAQDADLCTINCQGIARDLSQYYDYDDRTPHLVYVEPNWGYVLLDIIGIPLGLVGQGGITVSAKGTFTAIGITSSSVSFAGSTYNDDSVGQVLAVLSAIPVVGAFASAASLGRDLSSFEMQTYTPQIPRTDDTR